MARLALKVRDRAFAAPPDANASRAARSTVIEPRAEWRVGSGMKLPDWLNLKRVPRPCLRWECSLWGGLGLARGHIDVEAPHAEAARLNCVAVFIAVTLLPKVGFPVSVLHVVTGAPPSTATPSRDCVEWPWCSRARGCGRAPWRGVTRWARPPRRAARSRAAASARRQNRGSRTRGRCA